MSLERQIEATMVREADTIGGASFTADQILHKGRSARRRRRSMAGVAAVALAAAVALTATNLPGHTVSPQPWPFPTSPAQDGPSAQSLGISYANGPVIVPWNAPPFAMAVPPQTYIYRGSRVDGGWVVDTRTGYQPAVAWFQPDGGAAATRLASTTWAVSPDGRTLVVAGLTEPAVAAFRLPSMTKLAETRVPGQAHIIIGGLAVVGDRVLVYHSIGGATPYRTSQWDLASSALVDLGATVASWGTAKGSVLRLVDHGDVSCVDIMPIADLGNDVGNTGSSGTCSKELDLLSAGGALSPDGRQAVIAPSAGPALLVSTADLHAGVWRPTPITAAAHVGGWDSATTFVAYGDGDVPPALHCTGPDACVKIGLPAGDPWVTLLNDPS